jgi:hypothetical protein
MHYFLGLEASQGTHEVLLGHRKYTIEILKRFYMMNCKALATPMIPNLKLHDDLNLDLVDPSMYRQLTGYLMYLVSTRHDIDFAINTFSQCIV